MAGEIYKIMIFMKRRSGMSIEAFQKYYESRHAPLCEKYASGMVRYIRRYIEPKNHPETGPASEMSFDVITELWFDNESVFNGTVAYLTTNIMPKEIIRDEENLFDRRSFRIATVFECESNLGAKQPGQVLW